MTTKRSITRRGFLRRATTAAGAALAGPIVVPSSVFGADGQVAPSNRITIGMIGMGRQVVAYNLRPFVQWPDTEVVAVCDADRWRMEIARDRVATAGGKRRDIGQFKPCPRYTDFREVLARDDVDAVMISTPDHWHVAMAIAAAKAGKDICCEKPLTRCIAEGRILSDIVRQHKVVFRTDSEHRSRKPYHRAVELVRNGRIGKLQTIRMAVPTDDVPLPMQPEMPVPEELDYDMWLGPAPSVPYTEKRVHPQKAYERPGWYSNQDYCDGVIVNWGHHPADIAQWGNDSERTGPVEVTGSGEFPPADGLWNVLLRFNVQYRYANGVRLFYTARPWSEGPPYVRFEGTEGWVEAQHSPNKVTGEPASILTSKIGPDELHLPFRHEKRDFIDCVKSRGQTLEDAEVGHRSTSLCQLGYIAVQLGGQKLRWDPDAERFIDNDAANKLLTRPPGREPWNV